MTDFSQFPRYKTFLNRTILALDYGRKATGLALYTPGVHPYPITLERIIMGNDLKFVADLKHVIDDESVEVIVMGLPKFADGKSSLMTAEVENFAQTIQQHFKLDFYFQDETYTTEEAKRRMESSAQYNFKVDLKYIDSVAAQIILEDFIRSFDS